MSGWMLEKRYNISKHFSLEAQNDSLAKANAKLLQNEPQSFYHLQRRQNIFSAQEEWIHMAWI